MSASIRVGYEVDESLIAKFRTPLTGEVATYLAATVIKHPAHVVSVEGEWLILRHAEES